MIPIPEFLWRYGKPALRYAIRLLERRVLMLEAELASVQERLRTTRKLLKDGQELYVRSYVTKYWRGKDLKEAMEEEAFK